MSGPLCECGGGTNASYAFDTFLRLQSYTDGDGASHAITLKYGDDIIINQNGTTYVQTAVPRVTSVIEPLTSGSSRTLGFSYYPFGSADQDLPQTITLPSVVRHVL